jgi:transcriptional regulator with XRE-family HTH domain
MKTINYAQKLRKTRLFLNLTQRELSVHIGVSASSISRYENERTPVSPRVRKWVDRKYRQYHLSRKVIKSSKDNSVCAFMPERCYSIADDDKILRRLTLNPCIHDFTFNYVFQYMGTQGIHHCFREIHGGWSRTYTNSQLIDKRIQEVPYLAMAG